MKDLEALQLAPLCDRLVDDGRSVTDLDSKLKELVGSFFVGSEFTCAFRRL